MRPVRAAPRSEERCGAASCFLLDYCAVAIAAASCTWAMGARRGAIYCQGALVNHGTERCISFGGLRADHAVGSEVLRVLKPLGINAAVKAVEAQTSETSAAQRQLDMALQQARFSAAYARRQYDAVDPDNRLVASELERRWNEALQVVHRLEGEIAALEARKPAPVGEKERRLLMQLGADLESPGRTQLRRQQRAKGICAQRCTRSSRASKAASSRWSCIGRAETTLR